MENTSAVIPEGFEIETPQAASPAIPAGFEIEAPARSSEQDAPKGYGASKLAPEPEPTAQDRFTRTPIAFGQTYNAPDPNSANTSYGVDPKFTAAMYGQGPANLIEANMGDDPVANGRMLRHEAMHALLSSSTADYRQVLKDPVLQAASKPIIRIMKANGYREGDAEELGHELPAYMGAFTTSGTDPKTKLPDEWTSGVTPGMRNTYVAAFTRALGKQDPPTAAKYQRMLLDTSPGTPAASVNLQPGLPSPELVDQQTTTHAQTLAQRIMQNQLRQTSQWMADSPPPVPAPPLPTGLRRPDQFPQLPGGPPPGTPILGSPILPAEGLLFTAAAEGLSKLDRKIGMTGETGPKASRGIPPHTPILGGPVTPSPGRAPTLESFPRRATPEPPAQEPAQPVAAPPVEAPLQTGAATPKLWKPRAEPPAAAPPIPAGFEIETPARAASEKPAEVPPSTPPAAASTDVKMSSAPLHEPLHAAPSPGSIAHIPTSSIAVDPVRFQFKQNVGQKGVGDELKAVEHYDPELGGIISVWHDPADGKTYVVNGHHRVELAQRTGHPDMTVRYLNAENAQEARAKGALINIAEGRGEPLDAAKVFRDLKYGPDDLKKAGISLKGSIARTGMGLAHLDQGIFDAVASGEIPAETASVIGEMLPGRLADQRAVMDSIDKANARGKRMTPAEIRESIRVGLRPDQQITETQSTLFGDVSETRGLFAEVGQISDYIQKQLRQEKRLFGSVASEASAQRLAGAGNVINAEENARIAGDTSQAQAVYDKLSGMSGTVSDAITQGARELAEGGNANAVKQRAYEAVRAAISRTLSGTEGGVPQGLQGRGEGGSGEAGAGQHDLFGSAGEVDKPADKPPDNSGNRGAISPELLTLGADKFIEQDVAPVLKDVAAGIRDTTDDILKVLAPTLRDRSSEQASLILRNNLGELARKKDQAQHSVRQAEKYFNRQPAQENFDFIDRVENGQKQKTPELDAIASVLRKLYDGRRAEVQALGTGKLQSFYENYFAHIWEKPDRAKSVFAAFFGKRPLEGGKSFLKQRKYPTIADGRAAGLKPITDNPVSMTLLKIHEMDRYIMAHQTLADWKGSKLARFVDARTGQAPKGWKKIDDAIGTVYGQSVQQIAEYPNQGTYEGLAKAADALGIEHERGFTNLRGAIGRAYKGGPNLVRTMHGSKEGTLAHEIGHQIDWLAGSGKRFVLEYPDAQTVGRLKRAYATLKNIEGTTLEDRRSAREELKSLKGAIADRKEFQKQLRDLADLRGGPQAYVRSREEKMAQLAQMWVEGRPLFERTAPKVFAEWRKFLNENPKLHALRDIEAGANATSLSQPYDVGGLVIKGHWWAPEGAARILNNYLSPGLRKYGAYRVTLGLNNMLNQFQLGMSAFHLGFTAADTTVSKAALGFQSLMRGKPVQAAKFFAQTPTAAFTTFMKGDKMLKEWYRPGSQGGAIGKLVDDLVSAGGRARMDAVYRTQIGEKMMEALRHGNLLGAALRAPFAGVEWTSNLIMNEVVPRMKLGAFADMARFHLEALGPDATFEEARRVLTQDWNSVENRLGEMTYDNLFWDKTAKDLAMLSVRSVGWNLGTLREIGGGIADTVVQPMHALRGEPVNLNRLSYLLGLVTVNAIMSAIYQKLKTGNGPDEAEDYFFPKNGETDENGHSQRVSWPTYVKDVYHYGTHPFKAIEGKVAPIWSTFAEMIHNRDFYGTEIRNPDDPLVKQLGNLAKHGAEQFTPIGVRNYQRETKLGASPSSRAEQFVGVSPAPADLNQSPAERMAHELASANAGDEPRTAEATARRDLRQSLTRSLHAGKGAPKDVVEARKQGKLSKRDIEESFRAARETPLQRAFSGLGINDAVKVYTEASAEEKKQLQPMFVKKYRAAIERQAPADRPKTIAKVRAAIAGK